MISHVDFTKSLVYEIWRKSLIFALVAIFLGAGLLALSMVFIIRAFDVIWVIVAILAGVDILMAFYYGGRILSSINKVERVHSCAEITFEDDFLLLCIYRDGEKTGENKIHYRDIRRIRRTTHYLIAYLGNKSEFFPLERTPKIEELLRGKGLLQ